MLLLWVTDVVAGAAVDFDGSGLTCSAVTSSRRKAVPSGVQVSSVMIGLVVG